MTEYIAVIRKAPGTDYWIDIPDIPGCVSRGATPEEAKVHFREALALHLEKAAPAEPPRTAGQLTKEELEDAVETTIIEL